MVVTVDRGRWGCALGGDPDRVITAMRARELGRTPIVVGDDVDVVGDLSGLQDTLARIVRRGERRTVLRRTADDTDPAERVVVANADQLLIVVALADPPPRTGFVERALIAAYAGGLDPILCLTKTDLAPPEPFAAQFAGLDLKVVTTGRDASIDVITDMLTGKTTVLLGHSGVGKSTLVNRILPSAHRATGVVSGVGKGKHTSSQSVALPLPEIGLDHRHPWGAVVRSGPHRARRRDAGLLRSRRGHSGLPARVRPSRPARGPGVCAGLADRACRRPRDCRPTVVGGDGRGRDCIDTALRAKKCECTAPSALCQEIRARPRSSRRACRDAKPARSRPRSSGRGDVRWWDPL